MSAPTEDFLVVLDDKKFQDKSSFFSKDFGSSAASKLKGKISRKIGSTGVYSLMETKSSEVKRYLTPTTARLNSIYRMHPIDKTRYILISDFHETILNEKRDEFCNLLKSVGCKFIKWQNHPEWNKSYLNPDTTFVTNPSHGDELEKTYKYYKSSSTWQKAVHERIRTWCDVLRVDFTYDKHYNVRDSLIDVVYDKIGLTSKERDDLLKKAGITIPVSRTQSNLDDDAVYQLFKAVEDTVEVQFFSRQEYKTSNVRDLQKKWTILHVQAFLRVVGMDHVAQEFKDAKIDGKALFKMTSVSAVCNALAIPVVDATVLAGFINELGDIDHLDVLKRVQQDLEDGDSSYSIGKNDIVDKLVVNLGGVGTVDKFLKSESKLKGGGFKAGTNIKSLLNDPTFDTTDNDDWEGPQSSGPCCWGIFSNCTGSGYDDEDYDPDDFEWAEEMDDNRSMTSAGARSAFTGVSKRSDRPYPQQPRRKERGYDDNMSVASSSVSRPGASRRNQGNGNDYSAKPSRGLGQRAPQVDRRMMSSATSSRNEITVKTVLTGMPGVGKRRLLRRLGATEFTESRIRELTDSRIPSMELYDNFIVLNCDNGGSRLRQKLKDNRAALLNQGNRVAQCLFVVFDLTNLASFTSIAAFIQSKVENAQTIKWSSIVLVGNKLDLDKPPNGRVVTKRMALELCQQFGIEFYVETSAKTAQNVLEILSVMRYHCKEERAKDKGKKNGFLW